MTDLYNKLFNVIFTVGQKNKYCENKIYYSVETIEMHGCATSKDILIFKFMAEP